MITASGAQSEAFLSPLPLGEGEGEGAKRRDEKERRSGSPCSLTPHLTPTLSQRERAIGKDELEV